jgi:hypothetical protein
VLSASFMNYGYLLDEDGRNDIHIDIILLLKHMLELTDTSANIAQSKFHEIGIITW